MLFSLCYMGTRIKCRPLLLWQQALPTESSPWFISQTSLSMQLLISCFLSKQQMNIQLFRTLPEKLNHFFRKTKQNKPPGPTIQKQTKNQNQNKVHFLLIFPNDLPFNIWHLVTNLFQILNNHFRRSLYLCVSSSKLKCKSQWFCGREAIFIVSYFSPAHYTRPLPNTIAMYHFPALCTGSWLNLPECCCLGRSQGYHDVLAAVAVISRLQQALSPSWCHTAF